MTPKILLFDLETSPINAWVWERYETNVIFVEQESYLLCYAAKWLNGSIFAKSLPDFHGYKKNPTNDKALVESLWDLLDEADIVIAHNADQFDVKKANARFAHYGMKPPSPYKTVDTLKIARRMFKFSSNKLDDLGEHLRFGKKIKTDFSLWKGCMDGDKGSWAKMIRYNKRDVDLLQKIYLHFRPWIPNHPNVAILADKYGCPSCSSTMLQKRGRGITRSGTYVRYQCQSCGAWSRGSNQKLTDIT